MDEDTQTETLSLEALRNGDRVAFANLVDTYSGSIYRLALRMLNNPQDAEDILQETFLKAFRHIDRFDGRARLSTWLYRIATNEALMFLRRRRPDSFSIDEPVATEEGTQEPVQILDWCCVPETELLSAEGQAQLEKALEQLPHTLRIVFLLRDIEGLSTREAADVLNLTETAVKTRLSRARMQLREHLSVYYSDRLQQGEENER